MSAPPWLKRIDPHDGWMDRDWAAVPELREDGAAKVVLLTVDRVEAMAFDYWQTGRTFSFSIPRGERS